MFTDCTVTDWLENISPLKLVGWQEQKASKNQHKVRYAN